MDTRTNCLETAVKIGSLVAAMKPMEEVPLDEKDKAVVEQVTREYAGQDVEVEGVKFRIAAGNFEKFLEATARAEHIFEQLLPMNAPQKHTHALASRFIYAVAAEVHRPKSLDYVRAIIDRREPICKEFVTLVRYRRLVAACLCISAWPEMHSDILQVYSTQLN